MPRETNKPTHVTKGDVFDDLGFSTAEATVLKIKARILSALLQRIRQQRRSQARLAEILDDYQPNITILLSGKISNITIEKLLNYADRLRLNAEIKVKPIPRSRNARVA